MIIKAGRHKRIVSVNMTNKKWFSPWKAINSLQAANNSTYQYEGAGYTSESHFVGSFIYTDKKLWKKKKLGFNP